MMYLYFMDTPHIKKKCIKIAFQTFASMSSVYHHFYQMNQHKQHVIIFPNYAFSFHLSLARERVNMFYHFKRLCRQHNAAREISTSYGLT
jgi:hypothetical protein